MHSLKPGGGGGLTPNSKTLSNTNNTTTTFATLSTTSLGSVSGTCFFKIHADDGTNLIVASGQFEFNAVNKAGTLTIGPIQVVESDNPGTSGTLAPAPSVTASGTNIQLKVTPSWTTIVPSTVKIDYAVVAFGTTTLTPL